MSGQRMLLRLQGPSCYSIVQLPRIILFAPYRLVILSHALGSAQPQLVLNGELSPFPGRPFETTLLLDSGLVQLEHLQHLASQATKNPLYEIPVIGLEWL
jgi:hypothetical protein